MFDIVVIGSGVAGLSAAVRAAALGLTTAVVTKGGLHHATTRWAQGGVAAALEAPDSPELHFDDTLTAGAGLCDEDAVRILVTEGPPRVLDLMGLGAVFDTTGPGDGELALAREGGHSVARILHAGGDATGAEIERALVAAVRATAAEVRERWFSLDVIVEDGRGAGVVGLDAEGNREEIRARHVMLATGGAGQLFSVTTNPPLATGDGIAMAWRAGAALADVEFMQFHPTALDHPKMPRPLLSEALRGAGAVLRDEHGVKFMADEHPLADLAPRDIVARAIALRLRDRGLDHLWLDATAIDDFEHRFPTIWHSCRAVSLDPTHDWLPVAPAAHYISGGVCCDLDGATTLPGVWAAGEVACSGVHGANRLASNSLLDGLVFGPRAVDAIAVGKDAPDASGVLRGLLGEVGVPAAHGERDPFVTDATPAKLRESLQKELTRNAGILRDAGSLERAGWAASYLGLEASRLPVDDVPAAEVRNLCTVGRLLVAAAAARSESRGTHNRLDHPDPREELRGRFVLVPGAEPRFVALPEPAGAAV